MKLVIVGFGGVARSFVRLIRLSHPELKKRYHEEIRVVGIADSRGSTVDPRGLDLERVLALKEKRGIVTTKTRSPDAISIIESTDADIVVELTSTNPVDGEPGLTNVISSLKSGKSVVTANKGPLVVAYSSLMKTAEKNGVRLKYSATVGGGTPVLAFGEELAKTEPVIGVEAVLNQTSNYILTQMEESAVTFDEALEEAKRIGIAERDHSLDVDGVETACEMVIIANHVAKLPSRMSDVHRIEGIRWVTGKKIAQARNQGKVLRMVGTIGRRIQVRVLELDVNDPLAIKGARDATRYTTKHSGPKMVGSLAGSPLDTSSGLLRDVVDIGTMTRSR